MPISCSMSCQNHAYPFLSAMLAQDLGFGDNRNVDPDPFTRTCATSLTTRAFSKDLGSPPNLAELASVAKRKFIFASVPCRDSNSTDRGFQMGGRMLPVVQVSKPMSRIRADDGLGSRPQFRLDKNVAPKSRFACDIPHEQSSLLWKVRADGRENAPSRFHSDASQRPSFPMHHASQSYQYEVLGIL